jgi:DNA-binding Lrp family transcriptional regulator
VNPDVSGQGPSGAVSLDAVDRRLLAELEVDGRAPIAELATRCRISRATAYARLDRLRSTGVLTGFTITVDHEKAGLGITALVSVQMAQRAWRHALEVMAAMPGVSMVSATTGDADVILLVRVPDLATLRDVILDRLQELEEVRSTQSVIVLEEHWPGVLAKAWGAGR